METVEACKSSLLLDLKAVARKLAVTVAVLLEAVPEWQVVRLAYLR